MHKNETIVNFASESERHLSSSDEKDNNSDPAWTSPSHFVDMVSTTWVGVVSEALGVGWRSVKVGACICMYVCRMES